MWTKINLQLDRINDVTSLIVENDMDGEALATLIGLTPGPDCLKDLVKKVGWRLKVYKAIKELWGRKCEPEQ